LIRAYARVKQAAALANARLGLLPRAWARAIVWAANRVAEGTVPDAAVLDAFQAGAGTPIHMNVNEVIANLANERLGGRRGRWVPIHPNNHVNLAQSSNDVTPTAIRLVRVGEETGKLADMLAHASRIEATQALQRLQRLTRGLEPLLILLFGGFVMVVAAALLQAMYGLRPLS